MSGILAASLFASIAVARSSASVVVSATVVPYLCSTVTGGTEQIRISEADIHAGYLDVRGASLYIRTSDPRGYVVLFRLAGEPFDSALITGLPRDVEVGRAGAFVTGPRTIFQMTLRLRYRLRLSPAATPGTYRAPVMVKVYQPGRTP